MNSRWLYLQVHGRKPKRRSPRSARRGPARSWKFKAWVRTLPCVSCGGMSQKASDYSCIPLCGDCHTQATHSYHQDREACEARVRDYTRMSITEVSKTLNQQWKLGKEQSA